jgi:hypothetical protein
MFVVYFSANLCHIGKTIYIRLVVNSWEYRTKKTITQVCCLLAWHFVWINVTWWRKSGFRTPLFAIEIFSMFIQFPKTTLCRQKKRAFSRFVLTCIRRQEWFLNWSFPLRLTRYALKPIYTYKRKRINPIE